MKFGINAWVWTSPVTTEELEKLAPKVAEMGFDMIEIPLEDLSDLDFKRGAEIIRCGLGSAAVPPWASRDLIHRQSVRQNGMAYLKGLSTPAPHSAHQPRRAAGRRGRADLAAGAGGTRTTSTLVEPV